MHRFYQVLSIFVLATPSFVSAQLQTPSAPPAIAATAGPMDRPELRGQHPVPPVALYHRLICLVHLTGSGKPGDLRKPEYVPAAVSGDRSGVIAWSMQLSDDGKMAIVHYVAADRGAFADILKDTRPEVRVFEIGKDKPADIEKELGKFKAGFSLDSLQVVAR